MLALALRLSAINYALTDMTIFLAVVLAGLPSAWTSSLFRSLTCDIHPRVLDGTRDDSTDEEFDIMRKAVMGLSKIKADWKALSNTQVSNAALFETWLNEATRPWITSQNTDSYITNKIEIKGAMKVCTFNDCRSNP